MARAAEPVFTHRTALKVQSGGALISAALALSLTACREPSIPQRPTSAAPAPIDLGGSNSQGVSFTVGVPEWALVAESTSQGDFFRLASPFQARGHYRGGTEDVSLPEVPTRTFRIAVPQGAEIASVEIVADGVRVVEGVRIYPVQPPTRAPSQADPPTPFTFDEATWKEGAVRVTEPLAQRVVHSGEIEVRAITIPLVSYDPARERLEVPSSLKIDVRFTSSEGCFAYRRTSKEIERDGVDRLLDAKTQLVSQQVVNHAIVERAVCERQLPRVPLGVRLLIITDEAFLDAANTLAAHRRSLGITTRVVTTEQVAAAQGVTTASDADIRAYVNHLRTSQLVDLRWLLLFGDAEHIPTHYDSQNNSWDSAKNAGDMYYGQRSADALEIPTIGIGRISVDTATEAERVVQRVLDYELDGPPDGHAFYTSMAFAAEFQDGDDNGREDRWFSETTESIRERLLGPLQMTPLQIDRIYRYTGGSSPSRWHDGSSIPTELTPPTFAWNGSTADVKTAINAGRSVVYHRDHGGWGGWGTPGFHTGDLASLSIPDHAYPVVFSINCQSGIFDNETVDSPANKVGDGYGPSTTAAYWAETFLRQENGAIGIIGDTRSSATQLNDSMAQGLFDGAFPGPMGVPVRRLGDLLNHAKQHVADDGWSGGSLRQELHIYNLLGDPLVEIRTEPLTWLKIPRVELDLEEWRVIVPEPGCLSCPPWKGPGELVVVLEERLPREGEKSLATRELRAVGAPGETLRFPATRGAKQATVTISGEGVASARAVSEAR